jgi:hypothetical protein
VAQSQKLNGFGRATLHARSTGPILQRKERRSLDKSSAVECKLR